MVASFIGNTHMRAGRVEGISRLFVYWTHHQFNNKLKVSQSNLESKSWYSQFSKKKGTKLTILNKEKAQNSEFRWFFGRIDNTINCFGDLLTFMN